MTLLEELRTLDVDVDGGLKRIANNEKLYIKLLGSFTKSIDTYKVDADFDGNDYNDIIEKAHAIKGVSGNLSITPVYEAYTKIVDLLRAGKPEEARPILKDILPVQERIIACIQKYNE